MADVKRPLSEKPEATIPPPAIAAPPSPDTQRRSRSRRFFLRFLTLGLFFFFVHRWYVYPQAEIEEEVEAWLANPFSNHPNTFHAPHGHGKGHRILNGRLAEKLFLYATILLCDISAHSVI